MRKNVLELQEKYPSVLLVSSWLPETPQVGRVMYKRLFKKPKALIKQIKKQLGGVVKVGAGIGLGAVTGGLGGAVMGGLGGSRAARQGNWRGVGQGAALGFGAGAGMNALGLGNGGLGGSAYQGISGLFGGGGATPQTGGEYGTPLMQEAYGKGGGGMSGALGFLRQKIESGMGLTPEETQMYQGLTGGDSEEIEKILGGGLGLYGAYNDITGMQQNQQSQNQLNDLRQQILRDLGQDDDAMAREYSNQWMQKAEPQFAANMYSRGLQGSSGYGAGLANLTNQSLQQGEMLRQNRAQERIGQYGATTNPQIYGQQAGSQYNSDLGQLGSTIYNQGLSGVMQPQNLKNLYGSLVK